MTAQYVYGVTYAGIAIPGALQGIDGAPVRLVTHGRCGALVSDLAADRPLGVRADLMAHERTLEALAREHVPVLPFRFGAAMTGPAEVADEMLAPNQEAFLDDLDRITGRIELVVKGRYEEESAFREVLGEDPEVLGMREQIRGVPEDASHEQRIRIGERVAEALTRKQAADTERLLAVLAPFADEVAPRQAYEDEAANAAFLIEQSRRKDFDAALDELGDQWAGRVRLRVLGPVPPYDFVGSLQSPQA